MSPEHYCCHFLRRTRCKLSEKASGMLPKPTNFKSFFPFSAVCLSVLSHAGLGYSRHLKNHFSSCLPLCIVSSTLPRCGYRSQTADGPQILLPFRLQNHSAHSDIRGESIWQEDTPSINPMGHWTRDLLLCLLELSQHVGRHDPAPL